MIRSVAKMMKGAARTSQIIVATHSALLLNAFELDDILVFEKSSGNETVVKRYSEEDFAEHPSIHGKDIEHLQQKASYIMGVILRQVFAPQDKVKRSASGKVRDLKYGKLRHAPGIIAHLNPTDLIGKDRELRVFCEKVQGAEVM